MKNNPSPGHDLGKTLRYLRKSAGFTQECLAEKIGVSRTAVAKWENGSTEPTLGNIVQISRIFAVSTDYLLGIRTVQKNLISGLSAEAVNALEQFILEIKKTE